MHDHNLHQRQHSHSFGQERKRPGEGRTVAVVALTAVMMGIEIAAGLAFGSMALLADGLHMGSHATALGIALFAYVYARRHAHDERFSFGTGKVNGLAGFTGAILLALFALMMAWESVNRLLEPVPIAFNQAIVVAVLGLIVNGLSVRILGRHDEHDKHHAHHHSHDHHHHDDEHHHDHNLRSAYLHVLADALTSLFAIFALLTGKYLGWMWMDPLMGVVGAIMIAVWSRGLLRDTVRVLLDMQAPDEIRRALRDNLERQDGTEVADLHLWAIGPNLYAAAVSLVTHSPRSADQYHALIAEDARIVHATVEVHACTASTDGEQPHQGTER